ncbi:MAG: ParA family protein [Phormidium sp. BM_Day4_Bin.17]|nr:ParA family protein [Phormidium sp. BM_Day4_Bin.17]UCJ13504.1 MAG: ParA family protein [Phormidium sp. PBR-2020]
MKNWQRILESIPDGTAEQDFEDRFVIPFLEEVGFDGDRRTRDRSRQFTGYYNNKSYRVKPDFVCWSGVPEAENSHPYLVVENKAVNSEYWRDAVDKIKKSLQVVATPSMSGQTVSKSAQFGIATNGIYLQLFQRHGKISVPRTPRFELRKTPINQIIEEIRKNLDSPRRALTVMCWNNKGGVGKTTITTHLSSALSVRKNIQVLVLNFDLQADLNSLFNISRMSDYHSKAKLYLYDALCDVGTGNYEHIDDYPKMVVSKTYKQASINVIPGELSMFEVEAGEWNNRVDSLRMLLEKAGFYQDYDYIFIDASPSWRGMGELAAVASDIILPIIDNSDFSIEAVKRLKSIYLSFRNKGKWNIRRSPKPPTIEGYILNSRSRGSETEEAFFANTERKLERENLDEPVLARIKNLAKLQEIQTSIVKTYYNAKSSWDKLSELEKLEESKSNSIPRLFIKIANDIF